MAREETGIVSPTTVTIKCMEREERGRGRQLGLWVYNPLPIHPSHLPSRLWISYGGMIFS